MGDLRDEIEETIRETVEVVPIADGQWYVARGQYKDVDTSVQAGSPSAAITDLITKIWSKKTNEKRREREKEQRKERLDRREKQRTEQIEELKERTRDAEELIDEHFGE